MDFFPLRIVFVLFSCCAFRPGTDFVQKPIKVSQNLKILSLCVLREGFCPKTYGCFPFAYCFCLVFVLRVPPWDGFCPKTYKSFPKPEDVFPLRIVFVLFSYCAFRPGTDFVQKLM